MRPKKRRWVNDHDGWILFGYFAIMPCQETHKPNPSPLASHMKQIHVHAQHTESHLHRSLVLPSCVFCSSCVCELYGVIPQSNDFSWSMWLAHFKFTITTFLIIEMKTVRSFSNALYEYRKMCVSKEFSLFFCGFFCYCATCNAYVGKILKIAYPLFALIPVEIFFKTLRLKHEPKFVLWNKISLFA